MSDINHPKPNIASVANCLICSKHCSGSPLVLLLQTLTVFFLRSLCEASFSAVVQLPLHLSFLVTGSWHLVTIAASRSRVPAAAAQNAIAAAIPEPTAARSSTSRASRMAMTHIQRFAPVFPFVISAAFPPFATYNESQSLNWVLEGKVW